MIESNNTCPNCGMALAEMTCAHCEIAFVRCACGRLHPVWVRDCPYCHATGMPGRAVELNEAPHDSPEEQSRARSFYQRMRMLDAQADVKKAEAQTREVELMKPPISAPPIDLPEEPSRIRAMTDDYDPNLSYERDASKFWKYEMQRRQDERLNPNYIQKQAAGPAFLVFLALLMFYLMSRSVYFWGNNLEFITVPYSLIGIAIIWMILILVMDRIRPV
jgi:hypothetical protein